MSRMAGALEGEHDMRNANGKLCSYRNLNCMFDVKLNITLTNNYKMRNNVIKNLKNHVDSYILFQV